MDHLDRMIVIYSTFASEQEARELGRTLVAKKLAACVNIYPAIASIYSWQGAIEEAQEAVMLVKTRRALQDEVLAFMSEHHSYNVPALIVFEPADVSLKYFAWLREQTQAPA